ncbi:reverse rubrerythrin-1 [Methanobrevibacter woesei]|uniref:Reverse rubrerythrin-1 n=1 Tax=Methanobrevibacter woesei TaxID=190976 RepID=A0A2U1S6C0_9EURY|nr:ferritin family protein [Methanobrevibacter woesei]MCC9260757.1 rubrerythrin family protein [Methanobrevibacter woesei]PWB85168.1 reverse rubrerythrin-1 [Methanobrevibacter woesei]
MIKYEHKIGTTKGTDVEKEVQNNFMGETQEVGMYLAMSRQASREGYGELAEVFKRLAWEEAEHAARFAEMNGVIKETLKENIEMMLEGEKMANAEKREASEKAAEAGLEDATDFFKESSKDEGRHYKILEGILARYF